MRTRSFYVPTLLSMAVAAAFVVPGDSLTLHVEAKSKLTKTFETRIELASTSLSITIDGNVATHGAEAPKIEILDNEKIEVRDEVLSVADGRATVLQRTFVALTGDSLHTTSMPEGSAAEDQEDKIEKASPLDGKVVVFTWKGDACTAAWAEGEEGEDELLEKLEVDMDLAGLLPSKPVSDGDTWDLEATLFNKISSPGGRLRLDDESEGRSEENAAINEEIEKHIEGDGKATYKGAREVDGVRVGVIEITAELESHGTVESEGGTNTVEYKVRYSGEALWDLEAGHLHSLELEGKLNLSMDVSSQVEFDDKSFEMRQKVEFAGEIDHHVTVE